MITIQKQEILNYLRKSKEHPTAEVIYKAVKKKIPTISLGTVYRNLNILVENNLIREIKIKDKTRYDGNDIKHQHLICKNCGSIEDSEILEDYSKKIKKSVSKFKPEQITITVYGTCKNCKEK
jgi:Fur family transcriptional regulator, peroxide stress response regulator